ncbi:hypothetical protein ACH5RR_038543 [Cinchona calisaya]|uniref:Uncharacterized protein n=1 Tax=Cinchona calisaya TaxID=153742 RepID=A0ABD2Y110_9GENT
MVYSYHNVFKGFAAKLSAEDVKAMEKKPGFISAQPQMLWQGCHNWSFGLRNCARPSSFSDEGMPPPPAKWKGKCEFNTSVCNKKFIGARFFNVRKGSPMDEDGHGTHTVSTASRNFVKGANVFGSANGTAVGVAPLVHLAIYKVCTTKCPESDILAAMDTAIDDGVDVLSISIQGGSASSPFSHNNIALGAYSAMERGIFVSCSAGNSGPSNRSLSNKAPWILTVGASSIDRKIRTSALLGNNEEFDGESLFQPKDFPPTFFPLYYPGKTRSDLNSGYCGSGLLNDTLVQGKIVVCDNGGGIEGTAKGENVKNAGGIGMILINQLSQGYTLSADAHVLPATQLSYVDGIKALSYINSTKSPVGSILFKGTIIGDNHAPMVAAFSSRGPSGTSPGILKPDIIGPGMNILAAWHRSVENNTNTKATFNIISGTSMSCPHLSGVAALLKSVHPDWSPAAIKSAIMATADIVNLAKNPIEDQTLFPASIFATGSGHVNPARANNPGLIYDIESKDYIPYLCGLNYTNTKVGYLVQRKVNCTTKSSIPEAQLNYPSFSLIFGSNVPTYTRTVTNVGEANSVYTVKVIQPTGVNVTVKPDKLSFSEINQKLTYEVTFRKLASAANNVASQGSLTWTSEKFLVRSPIAAIIGRL